jgi:ubiquinone/menaquinone biosynthesis C-methylase UbiE
LNNSHDCAGDTSRLRVQIHRFYDRVAPVYGFWSALFESRAAGRAYEVARLARSERVLEVAVGGGEFFVELAKTAGPERCMGVDLSAPMLARTQRRMKAGGVAQHNLCRASALSLPFAEAAFDILFNLYMIDLLLESDVPPVLREFARVLRPGGRLILVSMAEQSRVVNAIWTWLYRRSPVMTGGCRPVPVIGILDANGWRIDLREIIIQGGFRSELIVAQYSREGVQ